MSDVVVIVLLVVVSILGVMLIPQLLIRRAMTSVIRIFRQCGAVGKSSAKTADELGLRPLGVFDRVMKPRDYKPRALQFLVRANIVRVTEDGKLYLSEENLASSQLQKGR